MSGTHETRQQGFSDFEERSDHLARDHLSEVKPDSGVKLEADADNSEAWCMECNQRVTVGQREYGHAKTCEHSSWERKQ